MKRFNALLLVVLLVLTLCLPVFATETDTLEFTVADGEATLVSGDNATGEVVIPSTYQGYPVTAIGESAFEYNYDITAVTIPGTVQRIGSDAFYYCSGLKQVTLSEGLKEIGNYAFESCSSLTGIVIPSSVTKAGNMTFYDCTALERIEIGGGLKSLGNYFFCGCTSLKEVTFAPNSKVETLWTSAFKDCIALESITLPESLVTIDGYCFKNCTALEKLTIPKNVKYIDTEAFMGCTALTKVTLPEGLKSIGICCFQNCENLSTINIPESVYRIRTDAFSGTQVNLDAIVPDTLVKDYNGGYYGDIQISANGIENYDEANRVLELVNQERAAQGLSALILDEALLGEAMLRAAEISVLYSHDRPNGEKSTSSLPLTNGENIAYGYDDADAVMEGWMNSECHRDNILFENYTCIGIGCFESDGRVYWVQTFSTRKNDITEVSPGGQEDVCTNVTVCTDAAMTNTSSVKEGEGNYALTDYYEYYYHLNVSLFNRTMELGEIAELYVCLENPDGREVEKLPEGSICYNTSDSSVVTINKDGQVQAVGGGIATITASIGDLTESCTVEVIGDCTGEENCPSERYTDISANSWYHQSVDFVTARGMMNGMSENKFGPSIPLTRGMMVTVLYRYEGSPVVETGIPFTDVASDTWYYDAVRWAAANGIVNGMTETTFEPQTDINREQMVTILQRYAI